MPRKSLCTVFLSILTKCCVQPMPKLPPLAATALSLGQPEVNRVHKREICHSEPLGTPKIFLPTLCNKEQFSCSCAVIVWIGT